MAMVIGTSITVSWPSQAGRSAHHCADPIAGWGIIPAGVEGRGGDQDRREVPQVDGHHRAVQALDTVPPAGPGQQPGGGRLSRQDQPGLGGGAGEQRDRRRAGVPGPTTSAGNALDATSLASRAAPAAASAHRRHRVRVSIPSRQAKPH